MIPDPILLTRLARSLQATMSAGRVVLPCGPFQLMLAPDSDDYLMNAAFPRHDVLEWEQPVQDLLALFAAENRRPRLEFFAELQPTLLPALLAAGLTLDIEAPVMTLPGPACRPGPQAGRRLTADDLDGIAALEAVQAAAYGSMLEPAGQAAYRPILLAGLADGSIRAAVLEVDGRTVAASMLLPGPEAAELAGVATLPACQRRGYAESLCRMLLNGWFADDGELAWLSSGPEARTLYPRLGFSPCGTQLNVGRKG
jgi:ribosomal protein S18 acetylase RimI-like enzyme